MTTHTAVRSVRRAERTDRRSIVVGVDGTEAGFAALEWAAAQAVARDLPLRIVHARPVIWCGDPHAALCASSLFTGLEAAADLVVRDAVSRARSTAPGIRVMSRIRQGSAASALLREARRDDLIVLGCAAHGAAGTVAAVERRARGQVEVVRPCW